MKNMKDVFRLKPKTPPACPNDRESLGVHTWNLLHTMAAYYPENPNKEYQTKCKAFMEGLAVLYPCRDCAEDFQDCIKTDPPRVESRKELSIWMCEQHNMVNEKLGKPIFECTMDALEKRWKTGYDGCAA